MTTEEKIREIILNLWRDSQGTSMYPNKEGNKQINQATQAILALMKPMSKERLIKIIKSSNPPVIGTDIFLVIPEDLADAILAEWGEGINAMTNKEIIECEHCGKKIKEADSYIDEDSHDILCSKCYFGNGSYIGEE